MYYCVECKWVTFALKCKNSNFSRLIHSTEHYKWVVIITKEENRTQSYSSSKRSSGKSICVVEIETACKKINPACIHCSKALKAFIWFLQIWEMCLPPPYHLQRITGWNFSEPKILSQRALICRFCECKKNHVHDWSSNFHSENDLLSWFSNPVECVQIFCQKRYHFRIFRRHADSLSFSFFIIIRARKAAAEISISDERYFIIAWTNKFFHDGESVWKVSSLPCAPHQTVKSFYAYVREGDSRMYGWFGAGAYCDFLQAKTITVSLRNLFGWCYRSVIINCTDHYCNCPAGGLNWILMPSVLIFNGSKLRCIQLGS